MSLTPSFWYRPANSDEPRAEKILSPLSLLYRAGYEIHQRSKMPEVFSIPIICIGNINVGGTGKTPIALSMMQKIKAMKLAYNPYFLTRGYGGAERGPLVVESSRHTSWDVGDEPLLLAREAPVIVSSDRAEGARFALTQGTDLVVMDDGLQNPGIAKALQCVVINGEMGFGNGKLLPAGPLREPVSKRFAQADVFIFTGEDQRGVKALLPEGKPVLQATLTANPARHTHSRYIAFAGLGYPDKFFNFLRNDLHLNVSDVISYPDHYPYTVQDVLALREKAEAAGTKLLTTTKDAARLPQGLEDLLEIVETSISWNDEALLEQVLRNAVKRNVS